MAADRAGHRAVAAAARAAAGDRDQIADVLRRAIAETAETARPVSVPDLSPG